MCQGDPTLYTQDHLHDPGHPDPSQALPVSAAEDFIYKAIDELSPALRKLSLDIWENPQLAWEETHASKAASDFIGAYGFKVSLPAYDIPTAFEAVFEHKADSQGAVCVGFNSEYDALPEIGHACGHNLICIAGIACAIATAQALVKFDIPGKIVLLGTPAEEKDGGKVALIDKGAYKQMDVCLMLHPAPVSALCKMLAVSEVSCEFFGKSAHAAGAPWLGVNALDAAVSAYTSISLLRQQSEPTTRMHGIIKTRENAAANVIPAWAALRYGFRTTEVGTLEVLRERIENLFHAAANATGCTVKIDWLFTYFDLRINTKLGDAYTKFMLHQGIKLPKSIPQAGSTDFGNVSYELPGLHPVYAIPTTGINHTPEFTTASKTPEAHAATLKASKGLAATAWKAITDSVFLAEVKEDFENDKKARVKGGSHAPASW